MSVNSSSNISLLSPLLCYSDSSLYPHIFTCLNHTVSSLIYVTFTLISILLLLPLHVLVLWRSFQQCCATSHSDVFTYYMVTVEIIGIVGSVVYSGAMATCSHMLVMIGYYFLFITYPVQTFFHCLMCVERYLAVVHPIIYLGLRKAGGVKVRNISIGCAWLLCFGLVGLTALHFPNFPTTELFAIYITVIIIVSFCTLSVLRVMIRLGLGKVGGSKERIDQSKQRAFYTILVITGALILRSFGLGAFNVIFSLGEGIGSNECVVLMSGAWLNLPSSLIPPLLFLYRTGKLPCFNRHMNEGET